MPGHRPHGQHAGLNPQVILDAAIDLADSQGLAALSMRRLGATLEVEAMTLYHYFPNKAALLDGIVERLVSAAELPIGTDTDWKDGLRRYARSGLDTLAAHPNLVPLMLSRPGTTAGNHRVMETLLQVLTRAGFDPRTALDLLYALNSLIVVHGAVRAGSDSPQPHGEEGQTSRLAELSPEDYPLLTAAARDSAGRGPTARFDAAVDALITGFAAARPTPHPKSAVQ